MMLFVLRKVVERSLHIVINRNMFVLIENAKYLLNKLSKEYFMIFAYMALINCYVLPIRKFCQDIFLPHVESGAITLIGATTENPSFSLNSALLSRCRVIILEKINSNCMYQILCRSLKTFHAIVPDKSGEPPNISDIGFVPK